MYCEHNHDELLQLLSRYTVQSNPVENAIVDSFGVVTPVECVPHITQLAGTVIATPPYPDDGIRGHFIEYIPLIQSIAAASGTSFHMIELGASYAPFAAISGVLAKRQNFNEICLLACEAAPRGIEHLQRNLEVNGLLNDPRVKVQVINGAVAARNGHVYFPDVDSTQDNGGKIKGVLHKLLSIGKPNKLARVKAYSLQSLLELNREQAIVDFIHCDIQGAEYDVFASCMPLLGKRVRRVFVATHSRTIEDRLFSLFDRSGWHLVAEDACKLGYNLTSSAEKLRLWADGGQYWRNRQLT